MKYPAVLRERARDVAQWRGWRRFGPVAGSVAFHGVAAGLIALTLGAALSEETPRERKRERPIALDFVMLEVPEPDAQPEVRPEPARLQPPPLEPPERIPDPEPPQPRPEPEPQQPEPPRPLPQASVTPPPRVAPRPAPEPTPEPPKPVPATEDASKEKEAPSTAPTPLLPAPSGANAPAEVDGGVYIPPSILVEPRGPAGLRGLAYGDPCESRFGKKPKECVDDWRGRVGTMDSLLPRSQDDLRQHYAEFMTPCPNKVGCEGGEWISTNGTRAPLDNTSAASGGAASVGGINDLVGRLPQKPDFVDPGFGD